MVVAPIPLKPFLHLLRGSARRLNSQLIVILVAREADCPWLFAEIDHDWTSIHDATGNDIIFVTIDGETHLPLSGGEHSYSLRDDVGALRGSYGLVAFSPGSRLMNQLHDDGLDYRQTQGWNQHPDEAFFARYARPKARREEWRNNQSLGMSSAVAALDGVTERMLPCLRIELVQADYSFTVQLRTDPPGSGDSVYRALRKVLIEGALLLPKIKASGEALRAQGVVPRKAAELAASIVWLKDWTASQPNLPPLVRQFIVAALEGDASPGAVFCTIAPLREMMDQPSFTALRGHLNRLTALPAFLSLATSVSDRFGVKARLDETCREFEIIVRRLFESYALEGGKVDPVSIITLISSGLKLVDQFRELVIRVKGNTATPPSGRAEQVGTALEVQHGGQVQQRIEANQLRMDQWDSVRYEALRKRISTQWDIYNDLFANEARASFTEGARVRADMRRTQEELCKDFKEMVSLYERALGTSLPDHYQLYEVCPG